MIDFFILFKKLPKELQSKVLIYFMDIHHKEEVYELKKLIKQSLFIETFFKRKLKFPMQIGKKNAFFNVNLINNKFFSFEDYHTYNVFINLINNNYEIIDYKRFRYIEENKTIIIFIEYTLEIDVLKDNIKSTKFYERTNYSYDRFNGKNYFKYLKYVSYVEYFPDKYEDEYIQSMNHLLDKKI